MTVGDLKKRLEDIEDGVEIVLLRPMEHPFKDGEVFCEYQPINEAKIDHLEPNYIFNTIVGYSELKGFVEPQEERSKVFKIN